MRVMSGSDQFTNRLIANTPCYGDKAHYDLYTYMQFYFFIFLVNWIAMYLAELLLQHVFDV